MKKTVKHIIAALALLAGGGLWASQSRYADTVVSEATSPGFMLRTVAVSGSGANTTTARAVSSSLDEVKTVTLHAGETIQVYNPRRAAWTSLALASGATEAAWQPDEGVAGDWKLKNSAQGTATFTVPAAMAAGSLAYPYGVYATAELDAAKKDGLYWLALADGVSLPGGYTAFPMGGSLYWLNKAPNGQAATTATGNGTMSATYSGFHLHTTGVSGGKTVRRLSSASELYPITYKAGGAVATTEPVASTLKAAQSTDGAFSWTPATLGTWVLSHTLDGTAHLATFALGDSAAASAYHLITWRRNAAAVIDTTYVKDGNTPTHDTPADWSDDLYRYSFKAWTPAVAAAKADATYTASWNSAKLISAATTAVSAPAQTYTGSALTPALTVKWNNSTTLTLNTDYTITKWENNTTPGTATVTIAGRGGYSGTATGTFTIGNATLTGGVIQSGALTYSGAAQTPSLTKTVQSKGGQTVTYSYRSSTGAGWSATVPTYTTSGTLYWKATAPNHNALEGSCAITVGNADITGTLAQSNTLTYNGGEQQPTAGGLSAKGSQAITVNYRTGTSGDYDLTALPKVKAAGTYTYYYQATANYHAAKTGTLTITVGRKTVTVKATATGKTYGASDPALAYTQDGLVSGDSFSGALVRTAGEDAGSYAIDVGTLTAGNNYTISFTGATFTISAAKVTAPASIASKVYNGQTQTATVAEQTGMTVKTNAGGKNVGSYDVVLALASTKNFVWSDNTTAEKTLTFSITAKTLTDAMVTGVNSSYAYTGSAIKPVPTVSDAAAGITANDYGFTYGDNTTVAQGGSVTVTAKGNYTGAVKKTFTISQKAMAITVVGTTQEKTYTGSEQSVNAAYSAPTSTDGLFDFSKVKYTAPAATKGTNAGDYAYGLTAANFSYDDANIKATFSVTDGKLTIKRATNGWTTEPAAKTGLTYSGAAQAVITTGTPKFGTAAYTVDGASGTTATAAGDHEVAWSVAGTDNYTALSGSGKATIARATLTATASSHTVTYGDGAPTYTVGYAGFKGSDTDAVVTTKATATSSYAKTSAPGGDYPVKASGAAAANYDFTYVDGKVTVNKATLTVTAADKSVTYGDAAPSYTVTYGGWKNSDTTAKLTTAPTATSTYAKTTDTGTYDITASGGASDYYAFNYVKGTLTVSAAGVSVTADNKTVTYGDAVPTYTFTYSGWKNSQSESVLTTKPTAACSYAKGSAATTYTITPSGAAAKNYTFTYQSGTLTVNKAALTVTAKPKSIVYGAAPANDGVTYEGFVNGETASVLGGSLAYDYSYAQYGDVGSSYTITPKGLTSGNYAISFKPGALTVTQREVTLAWANKGPFTYDGKSHCPTATAGSTVNGDTIGVTVEGGQTAASASDYTATAKALTGAKAANYKLPSASTQAFRINAASVTVKATDASKTYGESDPTLTAVVSGTVGGDTVSYSVSRTTGEAAGTYAITPSGDASQGNYAVTFKTGTFTINARTVTLAWNGTSLTYNGREQAPTATAGNLKGGDTVTVTVTGGKTDAGTYTATASALSDAKNYALPTANTTPFTIARKSIAGAAVALDKARFDYTGGAQGPSVTGVTIDGLAATYAVTDGSTGTDVNSYTLTVTGSGNFTGTATASWSIEKVAAKATVAAVENLVYSGAAQALVTCAGLEGGTIAYTVGGTTTSAVPTGVAPKSYTVAWKVTGDKNHSDIEGTATAAISGTVAGAATITLGDGVRVAIPAGATVKVSEGQAITEVTGGAVTVTRGGVRAETTGTVSAAGVITGEAVYLYGSQADVTAIADLPDKTRDGGTLKIKAQE